MKPKKSIKKFEYYALQYRQRGGNSTPVFLLFHAPAGDIAEWADVDRLGPENTTAAQRPLRELKVNKVARFLEKDSHNTIPTAVIVALDKEKIAFAGNSSQHDSGRHGTLRLTFDGSKKPGLIIDGQHRVFGVAKFSGETHLNVVAFVGGEDAERAFQFVVINNSATRVSRDHIKALNLQFDKDDLNNRLLRSAGVALGLDDVKYEDLQIIDSSQPFKGLLKLPTNSKGYIPPNAIESALAETRDRAALLGIEELERDVFLAVWSRIKKLRRPNWHENSAGRPSHLLQKVTIQTLTVYILDSLEASQRMADTPLDFTDEDTLFERVDRVVARIPEAFWMADWKAKELDTSAGRQMLLEALKVIDSNVRHKRSWYDGVPLIDAAELNDQGTKKPKA